MRHKKQAEAGDFFFCLMFLSGKKGSIMLNEIIKTAEELNTAALYYRQSGNMDGVRELAKAHAVSKKQTEEFIQGSRYRLVDIPIEERTFANASEKLRAEMFALKDAGFADIIGQYLVNLAKTDSALDAQVLKKHKMLQRCLDYVTQKAYNIALEGAKKKGENGIRANTGLALSGDQVFPWVLEYYAKDDEKEIAEKEQEEKKKIQKEWDSVNKRTKTIPKNQGTKKDSEVHPNCFLVNAIFSFSICNSANRYRYCLTIFTFSLSYFSLPLLSIAAHCSNGIIRYWYYCVAMYDATYSYTFNQSTRQVSA